MKLLEAVVSVVVTSAVFVPSAMGQTPPPPVYKAEGAIEAVPVDFELTSTGSHAVVRSVSTSFPPTNTGVISVWETLNGTLVAQTTPLGTFCSSASAAVATTTVNPSDAVRTTGSKAVLIGNHATTPKTLVDVVETSGPNAPLCLANFVLPIGAVGTILTNADEAHDVEVTPDGKFAIVNCNNWYFLLDLSTPTPFLVTQVNTGNSAPTWINMAQPVGPGTYAVDSVAVTNERAVIVQQALDTGTPIDPTNHFYPIVWLIDLTAASGGSVAPIRVDLRAILEPILHQDYRPHDVVITPPRFDGDLRMAVVTFNHGVTLIDLTNISSVFNLANPLLNVVGTHTEQFLRQAWFQVDSVDATPDHAVVIGYQPQNPPFQMAWSVKSFSLSQAGVPTLTLTGSFSGESVMPHDLSINPNADAAIISLGAHTIGSTVVLSNISTVTPLVTVLNSNGSPYRDWTQFPVPFPGQHARVSDSTHTFSFLVGGARKDYAVTIGGSPGVVTPISAVIDVFDLAGPSLLATLAAGDPEFPTMPTDLDFSSTMKRVFVRCEAPPDEGLPPLPPPTTGRDVLVLNVSTGTPYLEVGIAPAQIGGQGQIRSQVDSMIINRSRSISSSENLSATGGYVHTSTNP